jgi:hypothetical protein
MYTLDEGKRKGVMELCGAFSECVPLAVDSTVKLKRGQINVCTVCTVYSYTPSRLKFVPDWPPEVGHSNVCGK